MAISKSDPIVIVGAGTFGLSTALRLSEAGFHDIVVLEKDESLPSRFSAANDLNKIVRAEYEDPFYTELTLVMPPPPSPFPLPFQPFGPHLTCRPFSTYRKLFAGGKHPSSHRISTRQDFYTAFPVTRPKGPRPRSKDFARRQKSTRGLASTSSPLTDRKTSGGRPGNTTMGL